MAGYDLASGCRRPTSWPGSMAWRGSDGDEGTARHGLQMGFGAVPPPEIRRGVRDLAAALESEVG